MKTFYIDIYFLINFTVDILALYFAALLTKVKSTVRRLISASIVGAIFACIIAVISFRAFIFVVLLAISSFLITEIFTYRESWIRKIKYFLAFLFFETFIGGLIGFGFSILDKYLCPFLTEEVFGLENRNMFILALLILTSYFILKIFYIAFTGSAAEQSLEVEICVSEKKICVTALIDSGNVLCDPMDLSPVILLKKNQFEKLCECDLSVADPGQYKTRLRIIPTKSIGGERILFGIKSDFVLLKKNQKKIYGIVIAKDDIEGSYGGYFALLPSAIVT